MVLGRRADMRRSGDERPPRPEDPDLMILCGIPRTLGVAAVAWEQA